MTGFRLQMIWVTVVAVSIFPTARSFVCFELRNTLHDPHFLIHNKFTSVANSCTLPFIQPRKLQALINDAFDQENTPVPKQYSQPQKSNSVFLEEDAEASSTYSKISKREERNLKRELANDTLFARHVDS